MAIEDSTDLASQPEQLSEHRTNQLLDAVSSEAFDTWYQERTFRQNIQNGKPYFNGPSKTKPAKDHTPSKLLQCHRKIFYNALNAPAESERPSGIFWIGSQFEEDIALPFLREAVVSSDEYVTNSLWIEITETTDAGEIRIRGETDPVIVDAEGNPLILTEIKTKQSVDNLTAPDDHHRAQAHAYMKGLSTEYNRPITDTVFLYGSRETLDIKVFHCEFDRSFWQETVVPWLADQTSYRLYGDLPPASPEYSWECNVCDYRERCGKGEKELSSVGPVGLLPLYTDYPREQIVEYLESHPNAKLTPAAASEYPDLAETYGAFNWRCLTCGQEFDWDAVDWNSQLTTPPTCPACKNQETDSPSWLRGPDPANQH